MSGNSTQTFSGMSSGRNSSRVLAPPGGSSSIFFGEASAPMSTRAVECQAARNKSSVFATPPRHGAAKAHFEKKQLATCGAETAAAPDHALTKSSLFQEPAVCSPKGKTLNVHTSSRVLAPPGGRCHNIFG